MGFSDITFLLVYILIFLPIFFLTKGSARKYVLLFAGIIFYGVNDIYVLPILLVDILLVYLIGKRIGKCKKRGFKLFFTTIGTIIQLLLMVSSVLVVRPQMADYAGPFKYHMFIGVGFITIQTIGYYLDIYGNRLGQGSSLLDFFNYILFFPKILQGPITSYGEIMGQLKNLEKFNAERVENGIRFFVLGLSMKVLLADRIASVWNGAQTIGFDNISTPFAWLAMYSFSLQLFLDFQGYSLMAIGIAKMLGINLPDNFDAPYSSRSVAEFYRRWHMSLGNWFKNYIYIPMGGSRNGTFKMITSLFVVWFVTGLWHGLTINYLLWALVLYVLIVLEKTIFRGVVKSENIVARVIGHIYILMIIPCTWMVFAISDLSNLHMFFMRLFGQGLKAGTIINHGDYLEYVQKCSILLIAGCMCNFKVFERFFVVSKKIISKVAVFCLFWLCIYVIMKNGNNPFMYANF